MRFDKSTALCSLAASVANAFPAPQEHASVSATATLPTVASKETSIALDQLAALARFASDMTRESFETSSKQKRGLCTPSKLSV